MHSECHTFPSKPVHVNDQLPVRCLVVFTQILRWGCSCWLPEHQSRYVGLAVRVSIQMGCISIVSCGFFLSTHFLRLHCSKKHRIGESDVEDAYRKFAVTHFRTFTSVTMKERKETRKGITLDYWDAPMDHWWVSSDGWERMPLVSGLQLFNLVRTISWE